MRVLVTRSLIDAQETAVRLAARGHEAVIAPLLEIYFFDGAEVLLDGVQAILATSSNGVRALARRTPRRDVPVFAVGSQTAEMARTHGFQSVKDAEGDSRTLVLATLGWARPEEGDLFQAAGAESADLLAQGLTAHGFKVRRPSLYRAIAAESLPANAKSALQMGSLDAVLLYSPRSATSFVQGVEIAGLQACCRNVIACCISAAAATPLSSLCFKEVREAGHPDQNSLLALLD